MKRIFKPAYVCAFVYLFFILAPADGLAGTSQWDGTTNGLWHTATNWSGDGGKPPSDADTAIFNNDGNGNFRLDLGAGGATVKSILFQGASCPAYVIGTGRDQMLTVTDKGSIAVAGDADFQRFDSKITLPAGTYSFINNSTRNAILRFNNDITGSAAGKTTLTLGGASGEYPGRNPFGGVISGVISDGPNNTLEIIKDGKGTWTLEKRNYYSGGTTINEGTLRLLTGSYNLLGSGDVTIKDGGTLVIGERGPGVMKLDNDFYIQGTGQNNNGTIFNLQDSIIGGVVTLTGNTTIQSNYGALEFSEKIKGPYDLTVTGEWDVAVSGTLDLGGGSVIKEGAGTLILVDANTYSGGTILDSLGALDIRHAGALGSGPVTIKNGSVMFIRDLKGTPLDNDFTVEGFGVESKFGAIGNDDGNNTLTGKITLSGDACISSYHKGTSLTITGDIDGEHNLTLGLPKKIDYDWGAGDMFISGAIKIGAGSVYKEGSGTVTLSGANTYTGETGVYDGTLRIGSDFSGKINFSGDAFVEALNGKSITGDITTDTSGTGTLTLSGGNQNINGDIGAGNALKTINIDSGLAKTATFSGTVTAQNINMRGLGTAAFGNSITGAVNFVENGIVALAPGKTITGAVDNTSGVADTGILKFLGGSQSVSGDIGSTNMLHLVDIAAGTTTFGGNINTATLYFSGNGTAIIAGGKSITGDITTDNSGNGTLTLAGGKQNAYGTIGAIGKALNTVNFNGTTTLYNNIYAANTNINNGGNMSTNGNRNINGNLNVSGGGTLNIGSTQMQVSGGAFSSANNSAINVEISRVASGKIQATGGAASVNVGTSLFVNVIGHIPQNSQYTLIEGQASGGSVGALTNITDDSRRFYFTQVANTDNLILLSHRYTTFAADGKNANTRAIGATIDSIDAAGAVGDMLTIIDTLDTLDDTGITEALESMSPKVDTGAINNSTTMLNNFVNVSIERARNTLKIAQNRSYNTRAGKNVLIAQNRWHNTMTDISTGDEELYNGFWAKGYGSRLSQGSRKGIKGYDAWNAGTAFGIDRIFKDVAIIGISGGWTYGEVDSDTKDSNTRINSAQTTLYGGYRDNKYPFFMDASTSFAWNWYKARRRIAFANIDRVADASYDGQQYGAYLGGGYDFDISKNIKFTPLASLQWMHLHLGGYKETNAGSLNLDVKSQDYDILHSGLGASISGSFDFKWGSIIPEVHGKWLYDFIGDKVVMTSTFTSGGGAFDSEGYSPAQNSFNIGCKLGVDLKNNISLLSEFNTELRDKFFGMYGAVTLRYIF